MRARRDANGPRSADLVIDRAQHQVAVEDLDPPVAAVGDINIALSVGRDRVRRVELIRLISARPNRFDESPVLVVLDSPGVAIAVGDIDIPGRVPSHIGWSIEYVRSRFWRGSAGWL